MNMMSKEWVVLGAFKLKEWSITPFQGRAYLSHLPHIKGCPFFEDVSDKTFPEMMDLIAAHRCPIIYGGEVIENGTKEALDK